VELGTDDQAEVQLAARCEWPIISGDEQARAGRFVRRRDGRRFLLCRAALRMILGQLLGLRPEDIAFQAGPGGKPELVPGATGAVGLALRFNVTHSDDLALIAVCRGREVGVDVERMRSISEAARIVESYFTPSEQAEFIRYAEPDRAAAFLRGWTRKEAILKAKGVGLAGLAKAYETMFGSGALTERFTPASPMARVQEWSLWEAAPRAEYVAALAAAD
jgi:4'-phosphopantetheinyl transferase